MTGPGFDFAAVKVDRRRPLESLGQHAPNRDVGPYAEQLVMNARRYAEVFGHTWIGPEHLGLPQLCWTSRPVLKP